MFDRLSEGRWWDRPWSLVEGCTPCSPGCDHCWARAMERRFGRGGAVRFRADRLEIPLRRGIPTAYAIWNDLFHEAVTDEQIDRALAVAALCPQHVFLLLTKRAKRMREHLTRENTPGLVQVAAQRIDAPEAKRRGAIGEWFMAHPLDWPLPNVWLGVTVCNQAEADEKIPHLLRTPAAVRFISHEPALGSVDFKLRKYGVAPGGAVKLRDDCPVCADWPSPISWLIAGGETGPGARPAHPAWFRSARDQCQAAGVPFFFKGWGEYAPEDPALPVTGHPPEWGSWDADGVWDIWKRNGQQICGQVLSGRSEVVVRVGRKPAGRLIDGRKWNEIPEVQR